MSYLRNIHTGEIYPMNEHLMRRGDFEPVESLQAPAEVEAAAPTAEKPKAAPKPRKKKDAEVPLEPVPDVPDPDLDFDDELLADMDDVE